MEAVRALKKLGDAAYEQGSYTEAVDSYNLAIEKSNCVGQVDISIVSALHSNRCMCYIKLNQIHEASAAEKSLLLRPRWGRAHLRVAAIAELQGDLLKAISSYQRAAELDTSLKKEVEDPLKRLQATIAQQHCCAIMLPSSPPSLSTPTAPPLTPPPIYFATLCPHPIKINSLTTTILAAAYRDGTIRLWCTVTGALLQTLQKNMKNESSDYQAPVTTLTWSHDGRMLASGSLDMTCALWKLVEETQNYKLFSVLKGHTGRVSAVKFAATPSSSSSSFQESVLLITASTDLSIKVWKIDVSSTSSYSSDYPECLYTLSGHSSLVSDMDIDPISGSILVSASGDAQFKLWNIGIGENSGQLLENVAWESGPVVLCGFLPANQSPLLLTAHAQLARQEGRILLWDVVEKKDGWVDGRLAAPAWSLDGFIGRPTSWDACLITEEGERNSLDTSVLLAVACSDGTVQVWEILNKNTRPFELFGFEIINYSGGGGSRNSTHNEMPPWRAASISQQITPANAFTVKFSPRGRFLASTGGDINQNISVWSIQNGEEICAFAGHSGRIRSLEWSKDGNYLFSASEDGSVRKWCIKEK